MTRSEIIKQILENPVPPSDPEIFERNFQALFDELSSDLHVWVFIVSRYVTRNSDEDRLLLLNLLRSYKRNNAEAIAAFSAAFSGES